MQTSGRVSFVCRGADNPASGHKLDECPDYESGTRHVLGLVTQTATNEVAVVDLYAKSIVDIDQTSPGYSFLRVGAKPGAIVTTPGGAATFVGVSGLQKDGIFALPTTCVLPPQADEAARDLTTWAACHLSSPPGDIAVIVDPKIEGDAPRVSCLDEPPEPLTPRVDTCPADLTKESGPVGRRKLLVALPDEHKLVLLDAQRLLDQPPGSFNDCEPEATFALEGNVPTIPLSPQLPADLSPADGAACVSTSYKPGNTGLPSTPAGFATSGDRVYVADSTRPVVHVLDVSDPCTDRELPPLLPRSYTSPDRVVTTSRVAVSPLSNGKQFVYAVDHEDKPASLMVFDLAQIKPDAPDTRTPKIFEGSPRQPYLQPDRLRFSAPVRDVMTVMRDFPEPDPETGVGVYGLACDPDPNASGPATLYQPNADYTDGARPVNLRGVFAFAMLTNGQVAVIDVEDFDAPCRRPVSANPSDDFEDMHGCRGDDIEGSAFENAQGTRTVTGESSCNIVEPHRPRSASLSISSSSNGLRAPTLRSFVQFANPDPSNVLSVSEQPRLLATDFSNPDPNKSETLPAEVNISAQLYANCPDPMVVPPTAGPPCDGTAQDLIIDPNKAGAQNSLTLPLIEPRSYGADESPTLIFEGKVFPDRSSGFFEPALDSEAVLRDPDANFCGAGVEDVDTITASGEALGIPAANLPAWAEAHADYVQITGDYPASGDPYWVVGRGQECAARINPNSPEASNRDACVRMFGSLDNPAVLKTTRDLSVVRAYGGQLVVKPRGCQGDACKATLEQLRCCFPSGTAYTVRASQQWLLSGTGGLHDIAVGPDGRCEHTASCDRTKQHFGQRAFEVCDASRPDETHEEPVLDENGEPVLDENGLPKTTEITDFSCATTDPNVGCVGDPVPVLPGSQGSACIFENLTSRFVVYRGPQPSFRGMSFSWQTTGGFVPQALTMLPQSSSVNPQSMNYLPELGYLAVVDASTLGLLLFDLNSLGVVLPSPYY